MSCRKDCYKKILVVLSLLVMSILAVPAFAQGNTCIQNEYNLSQGVSATGTSGSTKLNCTANDVSIAQVTNIRDLHGNPLNTCSGGSPFSFIADFTIKTTSSQARENIGLYIATNSTTQALTGSCVDNIITRPHQCPNADAGVLCGSNNYHETDPAPDNCGDTSSNDGNGTGIEIVTLEIDNFACTAPAGSTQLVLPNCTSWQIPGGTIQCVSNDGLYPFNGPGGTPTAVPGTKSKCNCGVIPLGITVQSPQVTVGKTCNTSDNTTAPDFTTSPPTPNSCTIHPEGGQVVYTVNVVNTSNFGNIVIDQVCDTAYGTVYRSASAPAALAVCAAGSQTGVSITSTTCNATTLGNISASGQCTFTVTQAENITVNNIASVSGHGVSAGTFGPSTSNSVTVVSNEALTSGTITKGFGGNTAACATVRYNVAVTNTSASGTDETLSLNSLNDGSFGSITTVHDTVLGTTCGVANGLGTLAGTGNGAGVLPVTLGVNGGVYSCQFDAQICGGLDGNGCFTHSNTVSAGLTGDEGAGDVVSLTPGALDLKECIVGTPQ